MILPDDFITKVTSMPIELAVGMGRTTGYIAVDKFGVNPLVATTTDPEDIWEAGGLYNFDPDNTAPIVSLISTDAADTQFIVIEGLDINGYRVIQRIQLTGNVRAALTTPLWRVYRMFNDDVTSLAGTVYCYVGTGGVPVIANVRAMIFDGNNQTLMAIYTVPMGYVGFLWRGEVGVELASNVPSSLVEFANVHYESRRFGKVFRVKKSITCMVGGSAIYQDYRSFPDIIPAKTDIRIRAIEVSEDMGLFATFDVLLVDENKLDPAWLKTIGQPGYE